MIRWEHGVKSWLLYRIEAYLRRTGIRPATFGRAAVRDGLFVSQLRRGRVPRPRTEARVHAYLDQAERKLGLKPCRRRP
jgi:hypothetical protein